MNIVNIPVNVQLNVQHIRWFYTNNVDEFKSFIKGKGLDWLEENQVFCMLFVLYEESSQDVNFDNILDYSLVLDEVDPNRTSFRVIRYSHIAFNVENKKEYMDNFIKSYEELLNSYKQVIWRNVNV